MSQNSKKRRAVALKYPQGVEAPLIIAKGEGRIAEQIINEAEKNKIHIEEDSALVDLLGLSEVGSLVPEAAWKSLAVIFSYILSDKEEEKSE